MAALVGCSDDDSPPIIIDVEAGADGGATDGPVDTTGGGGGGESSTTTTPTTSEGTDILTVGGTGTSEPGTDGTATSEPGTEATSSAPVDPTSGILSSETPTDGTDVTIDTSVIPTSDVPTDTTGAQPTDDTEDLPPNLVANWDFEVNTAGWYSWNNDQDPQSTLATSAVKANTGNQSLLVSGGTAFGPAATQISAEAGATYEVTFWASAATASGQIRIVRSLECLAGTQEQWLWVVGNTPISPDEFTELTGTFTIPEDCDSTTFQVYAEGSSALDVYLDTVSVRLIAHGSGDTGSDTSDGPETTDVVDTDVVTTPDVDSGVVDTMSPDGGADSGVSLPNLVANSGFEVDTAGWGSWGSGVSLTASTDKARSGDQSLLVSGGAGVGPAATTISDIVPGGTYEVTFWASTGAGDASVHIVRSLACADVEYDWIVPNTTISDDAWAELTGTFTVPEDCDSPSFQVYAEGDTADADVYLDDVSVTLVSVPQEPVEAGVSTAPELDSGVAETSEPMVTSDEAETTAIVDGSDASVGDSTATDGVDAAITEEVTSLDVDASVPVDTSAPIETSAPADTTVGDVTSAPEVVNLVGDGTFESQAWSWYTFSDVGTLTLSSAQAHGGAQSLLMTAGNVVSTQISSPVPGSTYDISLWARVPSGTESVQLVFNLGCASNQYEWIANATVSASEWTELSGISTMVPLNCVSPNFQVFVQRSTTGDLYIDDVSVTEIQPG